jgi:hypothetical protein
MTKAWIIDVLTDLRRFAEGNDMPALVRQLEATKAVAASEIARQVDTPPGGRSHGAKTDRLSRKVAERFDA